jgi:hypothetical protein
LVGAPFVGLAVIAWMARDLRGSQSRAIILGLAVTNGAGSVVTLSMALSGLYNVALWMAVAIQLAFSGAFVLAFRRT